MLSLYISFTVLIGLGYLAFILYILYYWHKSQPDLKPRISKASIKLSVLIPARNEAEHIENCLESILQNKILDKYVKEILVINDHSTDNTAGIVKSIHHPLVRLIDLSHIKYNDQAGSKKHAIDVGLKEAKGDYILQTDADCTIGKGYIGALGELLEEYDISLLAAPVRIQPSNSILGHFQALDMSGMMAFTKAGIDSKKWYLANGANLTYEKSLAGKLDKTFASGDDISRIEHFAEIDSEKIHFANKTELLVSTQPQPDLESFIQQRLRWGTKNKYTRNILFLSIMGLVFVQSIWFYIHIPAMVMWKGPAILTFIAHLFLKITIDFLLLEVATKYYGLNKSMRYFLFSSLLQQAYISFLGTASLVVKRYWWKGRVVE